MTIFLESDEEDDDSDEDGDCSGHLKKFDIGVSYLRACCDLSPGDAVLLRGLKSNPELNKTLAVVGNRPSSSPGRFPIILPNKSMVSVKRENIMRII